jgi:hypothetical protein
MFQKPNLLTKRIFFSVGLIALIALAMTGVIDKTSKEFTDYSLEKGLAALAFARAIQAGIGVAVEIDFTVNLLGSGIDVPIGKALSHCSDMVDWFNTVMVTACISLGIQKALLALSTTILVSSITSLAVFCFGLAMWYPTVLNRSQRNTLTSFVMLCLFFRFAIPVMAFCNHAIYYSVLHEVHTQADQNLSKVAGSIEQTHIGASEESEQKEKSTLSAVTDWMGSTITSLNPIALFNNVRKAVENLPDYLIKLMTVFLINTLVFPVLFLWILTKLCKHFAKNMANTRQELSIIEMLPSGEFLLMPRENAPSMQAAGEAESSAQYQH